MAGKVSPLASIVALVAIAVAYGGGGGGLFAAASRIDNSGPGTRYCVSEQQKPASALPGNSSRPILVFIHVNKAGGSWIRSFLKYYANETGLRLDHNNLHQDRLRHKELNDKELELLADGLDIVNGAWGYCSLVQRPCMYLTHLRDPRDMAFSTYKYLCKLGGEGRKGWDPSWTSCDLNMADYFAQCCHHKEGEQLTLLTHKLVREVDQPGPRVGCLQSRVMEREAAVMTNLLSPCTRFILIRNSPEDELAHLVSLLERVFPLAPKIDLAGFADKGTPNSTPKLMEGTTDVQENHNFVERHTAMERLLFGKAEARYDDMWASPLQFC